MNDESSSSSLHTYNDSPTLNNQQFLRLIPPKTPILSLQILSALSPTIPQKNVKIEGLTPLISSILTGNFVLTYQLLDYKYCILDFQFQTFTFCNATAYNLALFLHHKDISELRCEAGPPLKYKLKGGNIVTFACEMGGTGDEQFYAAFQNRLVVNCFDQTDFRGRTVFMEAVVSNSLDTAKQFIFQAGRVDKNGKCAFNLALELNLIQMIEFCAAVDVEQQLVGLDIQVLRNYGAQVTE
ncbi:hypothetical protein SS50377_20170 [Spironucleus salmonicida]|uniref:Ankyrin repeat-containing protein n=1 Tax=Spironucleus salmonicida TaxID=348837 RepID=V6LKS2_9EUKA|nr:hypothetical protein SS50377_20170 [Spironucleus salmonicida]|eukprot:EST45225.1 Hypothetical protein SS50377_14800 [Spironucleus salmonicida]